MVKLNLQLKFPVRLTLAYSISIMKDVLARWFLGVSVRTRVLFVDTLHIQNHNSALLCPPIHIFQNLISLALNVHR